MIVQPKKHGDIIRNPETKRPLKQSGEKVHLSTYWRRRLADGSVIEVRPAPKKIKKEKDKKDNGGTE